MPAATMITPPSEEAYVNVVVIGAGVSGLTTALLLAKEGLKVTIVAKHMPGDSDIEYCSPWAGANFMPMNPEGSFAADMERATGPQLFELAAKTPEAGIHFQPTYIYAREKDAINPLTRSLTRKPWYGEIFPHFTTVPESPGSGFDYHQEFRSVCINTALYLPWLASECLKRGVKFQRGEVKDIDHIHGFSQDDMFFDLIINCTGLGSRTLGGVNDGTMYPVRGQVVVVRNSPGKMVLVSGTDDGNDEVCYIMERAAGGGTILGGSYQVGQWESQPDPNLAMRIMERAVKICPDLTDGKGIEALSVIRHGVGLRPARKDGVRVEKETIGEMTVIHNYGHGGYGYQTSWACAQKVVELALAQ